MSSYSRSVFAAATFVATIVATVSACGGADAVPRVEESAAIPVRVAVPELRHAMPAMVLTGTLGAKEEIPLAFKMGGVVNRIAVEAGQSVRAGDLLAELALTEIDAQVSAAREGRDKAARDLARAERLFADSIATLSQVEDARTQRDVTAAQLRAAAFNRQYAVVRAPAAGVVLRRMIETGQFVSASSPVFVLRTAGKGLVLRAAASDRDAVRLAPGERAEVRFDAFPGKQFAGRVERVGVAASPLTGTYEVEIAVDPADSRLSSGLIGRATLSPSSASPVLMIPAEALLEVDGNEASVFVVSEAGGTAQRVKIRVLFLDGAWAAIEGDVTESSRVVTAGATRLSDGARVTVTAGQAP